IGLGGFIQPQQMADHGLYLGFVGSTGSHHGLFDLAGGVFKNRQLAESTGDDGGSPGLPQLKGGISVAGHEHLFNADFLGMVKTDDLADAAENDIELFAQILGGLGANAAAVNVVESGTFSADHTVSGYA